MKISNIKDTLVIITILSGVIFYFSPRNLYNTDVEFIKSILVSLKFELFVILCFVLATVYRKKIINGLHSTGINKAAFSSLGTATKFIFCIGLMFFISKVSGPLTNIVINRIFYYENVLHKKFFDDFTLNALNYEENLEYNRALTTYKKLLKISDNYQLREACKVKVKYIENKLYVANRLVTKSLKDSINREYSKIEVSILNHALSLNPNSKLLKNSISDVNKHVNYSIDLFLKERENLDKKKLENCKFESLRPYIWLFISQHNLKSKDFNDAEFCVLYHKLMSRPKEEIMKQLQIAWFS